MESQMTNEQMKELAELRVAIQDLKYQLIQKHDLCELTDGEILNIYLEQTNGNKDLDILEFAKLILKKAGEK